MNSPQVKRLKSQTIACTNEPKRLISSALCANPPKANHSTKKRLMNTYLLIVLGAIIGEYLIQSTVRILNLRSLKPNLPEEFAGFYDANEYRRSQEYTRVNSNFAFVSSTISTLAICAFILLGGFNEIDELVRGPGFSPLVTGLLFFAVLFILSDILSLPFSLYGNFVIEEKFGFNRLTIKTFVIDKIKSYVLVAILGGCFMGAILYFFEQLGEDAWLYAWGIFTAFIVIMPPLFTSVIAPLFNKFEPLEEGTLKESLAAYAQKVNFPLTGVFVMDGSKRSTKSNAYFSGFGKKKRIVLFDTLIQEHSSEELVAILAHEIGHYQKKHIIKGVILSVLQMGVLFFLLSKFLNNPELFEAFKMSHTSVYASLVFFSLLYSPISFVLSIVQNIISRFHEYEADEFSASTVGNHEALISGLKRLAVNNLGNLTPHKFSVFLNHSHPTVLQRIARLRNRSSSVA